MNHTIISLFVLVTVISAVPAGETPLRVCATVPDLAVLVSAVGGDQVTVTAFAKGAEDPHFIEARPSFVRALADADLFIQTGLELEIGWAPVLLKNARNERVLPGAPGFLEAASVITPLEVPSGVVDRSLGDVHPGGNPHFLIDPVCGLKVAEAIRAKLAELRPAAASVFAQRYRDFAKLIGERLFGVELAGKYDPSKLVLLVERGALMPFLIAQHDELKLAGWLGQVRPFADRKVVADHAVWPYFARTFAFQVVGYLEPKPGIPPTTRHLQELITQMRQQGVGVILTTPFFEPKHARVVAEQTTARIAAMAHQVGALSGTEDYLAFVDHNVQALVQAYQGSK